MDSKAVSEVLGYILVFGMVVMAVFIIYIQFYPEIQRQQDISVFKSMEDTFTVLKNVEELVAYGASPSKTISLRVERGIIYAKPNTQWNITVGGKKFTTHGVITYEVRDMKILLENGAIIECFGKECIMMSKPRIIRKSGEIFLSLINIRGSLALSGFGQISLENNGSEVYKGSNTNISIEFNTPAREVWIKYFKDLGFTESSNSVTCKNVNVTIAIHNITLH